MTPYFLKYSILNQARALGIRWRLEDLSHAELEAMGAIQAQLRKSDGVKAAKQAEKDAAKNATKTGGTVGSQTRS